MLFIGDFLVFVVIKWVGISYLIYLAIITWRSSPVAVNNVVQPRHKGISAQILAGYTITISNPKAMLFYLAILPSIVQPGRVSLVMALFLCLAIIAVLATVFTA